MRIERTVYDYDKDEETTVSFPAKYEVCGCCSGRGTTYLGWHASEQPAFTQEDFAREGPAFYDDYMSGGYDRPCPECKGLRVVETINRDCLNDEQLKALEYLDEAAREREYDARVQAAEMGWY